jgi:hypothetical protein
VRKAVKAVSLEDRFRRFAGEQEDPVRQHRDAYEENVEYLKKVDSMISKILETFCQAVGWGLKRNDCCDRAKGAVSCNYILEHRDSWREGFVAVDVDVTWGSQSNPLETVTVYQGDIVGTTDHVRVFSSRVVIPFAKLTEERLAAALEQQSGDLIRRISHHEKPQSHLDPM